MNAECICLQNYLAFSIYTNNNIQWKRNKNNRSSTFCLLKSKVWNHRAELILHLGLTFSSAICCTSHTKNDATTIRLRWATEFINLVFVAVAWATQDHEHRSTLRHVFHFSTQIFSFDFIIWDSCLEIALVTWKIILKWSTFSFKHKINVPMKEPRCVLKQLKV